MKTFLEAGVHFGHQTKRWHPNMAPYIYGIKNGVHVIDLRQTLSKLKEAYEYVKASAAEGRVPLFVGTKTQIQRIVKEEAERCGSPYINFRWLGGLLTNFGTVKQSIARMKTFEEIAGEDGSYEGVLKKEALMMERKRMKLERSLGGVRNMKSVPSMLFITDCHKEQLALKEALKLRIPVIGVADTNCDPTEIDYVIPGNDDSPRAVALYANIISTAVMEGLAVYKQRRIEPPAEAKPVAKKSKPKDKNSVQKQTKTEEKSLHAKFVTLSTLFKSSDILSIHLPYSKETHEIVNKNMIRKMKKSSFIINTSRGKIINENDLTNSLKRERISGAALDVFSNEPIGKKHPLNKMNNVVLVPHIGSSTKETRKKMAEITVMNLKLGLNGKKLLYSV